MKFLLVLVVLVVAFAWWTSGRRRDGPAGGAARRAPDESAAQPMLACVHCGVHVPRGDAVLDAAGQPFCSDAHRLQGVR